MSVAETLFENFKVTGDTTSTTVEFFIISDGSSMSDRKTYMTDTLPTEIASTYTVSVLSAAIIPAK